MSDDSDMDYASGSEAECGLEEQYYSAKEASPSGSIEEAVRGLENIVETDVDHTKWGFKALKRIVKLLIRKIFPGRLTCLKWLARLAQQCPSEDHQRQLEGKVDSFQKVIEDALTMDEISDVAKTYFVDALSLTTLLFLRQTRFAQVESNLDRLVQIAVDTSRAVECNVFIKEMKARVAFVRGKYAASFVLLLDAKGLYEGCESTSSQRAHLHLRLMSLLMPKAVDNAVRISDRIYAIPANYSVWTTERALVEEIVQCFNDGDVARLRSTAKDAQADLGHFAAVELCGALIRNQLFRQMASENWLDTFSCLSRWDVDGFHLVGRRLSNFVSTNSRALQLKNISKVSLKKVIEPSFDQYTRQNIRIERVRLTVETVRGSAAFCKKPSHDQKCDVFTIVLDVRPTFGHLRSLLANAFVELLDLDYTVWSSSLNVPANNGPLLRIKKIRQNFGSGTHPRLLPLRGFGDVSVDHVEIRLVNLDPAPTDFFGPLRGAEVSHLCVNFDYVVTAGEQTAFLAFCFDQHREGPTPHILVHNADVRRDYLKRLVEMARWSRCACDLYIELHWCSAEGFSLTQTDFADCTKESSGHLRIFSFEWQNSRMRMEVGLHKVLARYSPKRT